MMKEENLKDMQGKAFKPKTTDSEGVAAAPKLLAGIKIEDYAFGKIILGERFLHSAARRKVLLIGNLAGLR